NEWRPTLEGKLAREFAALTKAMNDQDAYARVTRQLIRDLDLDLGDTDEASAADESENEDGSEGQDGKPGEDQSERDRLEAARGEAESAPASAEVEEE